MLPFNRVYTADELRAMSRLRPAAHPSPFGLTGEPAVAQPADPGRGRAVPTTFARLLGRLLGRTGPRRSVPEAI